MTPEDLSALTVAALRSLVDRGDVRLADGVPATVAVERPRQSGHGDYATNAALQLAKPSGLRPRDLAELIRGELLTADQVSAVEVAGPGFLNVTVESSAQARVAADIVAAGDRYGDSDLLAGQRINLEFVSANPTGPLHLGGARWAAVGDALARILTAAGGEVTREYYFNDHGAQIDRFARSLYAAASGLPTPEDGYAGDYVTEIADRVAAAHPELGDLDEAEAVEIFRADGVALMFDEIKADLRAFGVEFDVYFHEESLHRTGAVQRAIDRLTERGSTYRRDDALWLRTEQYGDDKDRVIVRSDGTGAYLSGDLAYYLDKRERGYDRCLILLGADHHGYVGRMMAMCAAFGDEPGVNLQILIGQMVNLLRDGQSAKLSKRSGTVVTQAGLVAAIGVDAARYALTRYSMDTTIDLDLDLWSRQHQDNPVYYVQYAHARVCSLLRNAADLGLAPAAGADFDASLLTEAAEGDLLRSLAELPTVVAAAARLLEPHRVARYLEETAAAYHRFYDRCRVLPQGDEEPSLLHGARLTLVEATRIVLARGLDLLGVTAPERM